MVSEYWRDYEDHRADFIPAFLGNDILRLWRTFCVNYEAGSQKTPDEAKAKRKLKNYKLKHSRMLTCYSALLYLLVLYGQQNTVSPVDARSMIRLTPTERLAWVKGEVSDKETSELITKLLASYEDFLRITNASESTLIEQFRDKKFATERLASAYQFGDLVFDVLNRIGDGNRFHRLLVV